MNSGLSGIIWSSGSILCFCLLSSSNISSAQSPLPGNPQLTCAEVDADTDSKAPLHLGQIQKVQ